MKYVILPLLCAAFSLQCCDKLSVTIRPAQLDDIEHLNKLSEKQYQNDFKPLWEKSYATLFPNLNIETLIAEKTKLNNENNEKIIKNRDPNKPNRLLVAEIENEKTRTKKIAGFCRFEQKDEQTMYINFVLVDENFRKQGIAQQLSLAAMNTFPNATTCKFRAHVHDNKINQIYTEHGCQQLGAVSLDLDTGEINPDPNAPITHYDYKYTIKR